MTEFKCKFGMHAGRGEQCDAGLCGGRRVTHLAPSQHLIIQYRAASEQPVP